jgi:hypothetical protein
MRTIIPTLQALAAHQQVVSAALSRWAERKPPKAVVYEEFSTIIQHAPPGSNLADVHITFAKFPATKEFYVFFVEKFPGATPEQRAKQHKITIYRGLDHSQAQAKFAQFF